MFNSLSVAPMMNWTDKHCRRFHSIINKTALLYTEMVTTGAILYGSPKKHLFDEYLSSNIILQLGGSEPEHLYKSAIIAKQYGYSNINLNCGCPSPRVQKGSFGACLMLEPTLVAECLNAIQQSGVNTSVKCRIGVDDNDSYDFLANFVTEVTKQGINEVIIHARKALLQGLSPKQNREIPELKYDFVYKIKQQFPKLNIVINGGINTIESITEHLQKVDQVMIGRAAYSNPMLLAEVGESLKMPVEKNRIEIFKLFMNYAIAELEAKNVYNLHQITRHIYGLFNNQTGSKRFRRLLAEGAYKIDNAKAAEVFLNKILQCIKS